MKSLPVVASPGDSLRTQIDEIQSGDVGAWIAVMVLVVMLALVEWIRWLVALPPQPWTFTVAAVLIVAFAVRKLRHILLHLRRLKKGLEGEIYVGQYLTNELRPLGYYVLHDIREADYNIDHVLIGPGGVFAVETKNPTKPAGDCRVTYDGQAIRVNGHTPDRDPLIQAQAASRRIGEILKEYAGEQVPVRGIVLYPGWFVERQPRGVETWVLNEKALPHFLNYEAPRLTTQQITVLKHALERSQRERSRSKVP